MKHLRVYHTNDFMALDESTRRNLEITESISNSASGPTLLKIIDDTRSPMGKRLIRNWINRPLIHKENIEDRWACVESFLEDGMARMEIQTILGQLSDIERIINRVRINHATPRDLVSLKHSLQEIPGLRTQIGS